MDKNTVKKQLILARKLCQQGNLAAAKNTCLSILETARTNQETLGLLGEIELNLNNINRAFDLLSEASKNSKNAHVQIQFAVCLLRLERFDDAEKAFQKALKLEPQNILAQKGLGELYCRIALKNDSQSAYQSAEKYLRKTLSKLPRDAGVLTNLSVTLQALNQHKEALKYGLKALEINPADEIANNSVGSIYSELGEFDKALSYYRKSLAKKQVNSQVFRNFVTAKKFTLNDSDLALVKNQEDLLKKYRFDDENTRAMYFALGKVYDDIGDWDKAFNYFDQANKLVKVQFDRNALTKKHYLIKEAFSELSLESSHDEPLKDDIGPVFIVGMPRSGSSLVEQIITKHSRFIGLGEYQGIFNIINALNKDTGTGNAYLEKISSLDETLKSELRNIYFKDHVKNGRIPVDKMLSNYENIGLITLLFPNARIIHCERNSLDVCLSAYTQDFTSQAAHTYDLGDLAFFYREYRQMMDFWNSRQPDLILNIIYEELVDNLPDLSKKMIEFCGVDWEESCLEFYTNERSVQTSSKWQVRQPIYKTSVNRWKNYEKHLDSLKRALDGNPDEEPQSKSTQTSIISKFNPFRLFG